MRKSPTPGRTTHIKFGYGEDDYDWLVPFGFGVMYKEATPQLLMNTTEEQHRIVRDAMELIGWTVSFERFCKWSVQERVEAWLYAVNVHLRAGDNPVKRHPPPTWATPNPGPWLGPSPDLSHIREDLRGAFSGPGPTEVL